MLDNKPTIAHVMWQLLTKIKTNHQYSFPHRWVISFHRLSLSYRWFKPPLFMLVEITRIGESTRSGYLISLTVKGMWSNGACVFQCNVNRSRLKCVELDSNGADMRVPTGLCSQTLDCVLECCWETLKCGRRACEQLAVTHHLLAQPYPHLDVIIAAPTLARRR